jgi:hypothetical protein
MNKREKVIKGLECCKEENCNGIDCPYSMNYMCFPQIAEDALALIQELMVIEKERPKVILCKECAHSSKSLSPFREYGRWCMKHDRYVNSDFYCGDAKEMAKNE